MWELYDHLISKVPDNLEVANCLAGLNWFLVRSEGVGVAMRPLAFLKGFQDQCEWALKGGIDSQATTGSYSYLNASIGSSCDALCAG